MSKQSMREALTQIAREVERTEVGDLHKIRRIATNALAQPDFQELALRIKAFLENEDNSLSDCYELIVAEYEEIGIEIRDYADIDYTVRDPNFPI